uniref:Uncharacterized protein n=1 Tax=Romanomermis culicivorax TaxID=13658 RepID=A0A915K7I8_ROMCU
MAIFLRLMITSSWNHSLRKILAVLDDGVKHHSNVIRSAETSTHFIETDHIQLKHGFPKKLTCFVPSLTMRIVTVHLSMNGALNQTRSRGSLSKSPGAVELRIDITVTSDIQRKLYDVRPECVSNSDDDPNLLCDDRRSDDNTRPCSGKSNCENNLPVELLFLECISVQESNISRPLEEELSRNNVSYIMLNRKLIKPYCPQGLR